MSEKLEQKAIEVIDKTIEGASVAAQSLPTIGEKMEKAVTLLAAKLESLTEQHGEAAINLLLNTARVDAMSGLLKAAPFLIASAFVLYLVYRCIMQVIALIRQGDKEVSNNFGMFMFMVLFSVIGGGIALITFFHNIHIMFNAWRWVGMFEPSVWLAGKALGWI